MQRVSYKHFVAEANPEQAEFLGLKNNNTGRVMFCYLSSLNEMLAVMPKLFKLQNNTNPEGPDCEIYNEEIVKYGNKKIMAIVKRFSGKVSVCFQMMYDENLDGVYKYSPYLIQFSQEDDLESLRTFGQKTKHDNEAYLKSKASTSAAEVEVEVSL